MQPFREQDFERITNDELIRNILELQNYLMSFNDEIEIIKSENREVDHDNEELQKKIREIVEDTKRKSSELNQYQYQNPNQNLNEHQNKKGEEVKEKEHKSTKEVEINQTEKKGKGIIENNASFNKEQTINKKNNDTIFPEGPTKNIYNLIMEKEKINSIFSLATSAISNSLFKFTKENNTPEKPKEDSKKPTQDPNLNKTVIKRNESFSMNQHSVPVKVSRIQQNIQNISKNNNDNTSSVCGKDPSLKTFDSINNKTELQETKEITGNHQKEGSEIKREKKNQTEIIKDKCEEQHSETMKNKENKVGYTEGDIKKHEDIDKYIIENDNKEIK